MARRTRLKFRQGSFGVSLAFDSSFLIAVSVAADNVHGRFRGPSRSAGRSAELKPRYIIKIQHDGSLQVRWIWREFNTVHKLKHLPLHLLPAGVACLMDAVYTGSHLAVTIILKCPAYDMFALQLREDIEQAVKRLSAEPVRIPYDTPEWSEFHEQEIMKWQLVYGDTRPLRKPTHRYSLPRWKVHRIAREELKSHGKSLRKLQSLDTHLFELLGSQAIIPKLSVSIHEDYGWTVRTRFHQVARHDAYRPALDD